MFSSTVTQHWLPLSADAAHASSGELDVVVDETLPQHRRLSVLEPTGRAGIVSASPAIAHELGLEHGATVGSSQLEAALQRAGLSLHGADALLYLPAEGHELLVQASAPSHVRQLTDADATAFAAFEQEAPAGDLDDAFVELDHWLVFGAFVEGELACAASMYPWAGTALADLGVLTLPRFQRRGLARQAVRAMSAHALSLGYEPQYRCQLDNLASIALARAAGFAAFGTWDVVADPDEDEASGTR
ncbi:GNAT family N-acetyltransferase [Agrococcus sp. 1P02AA]|uniref:GNAT family N-acetyltransferase n=1 Tax=Agrococcus sp. 1P02AA TaxID=3132259 RepID=UPI0039A542AC